MTGVSSMAAARTNSVEGCGDAGRRSASTPVDTAAAQKADRHR